MFIQKIRLKNFKSFYSETEIDFERLVGLWRVSGQIGAGKTTIGEAIIYGLYGKVADKTNGSLISWGCKKALVELWCISRGRRIYIRREINAYGQSPMTVEVDGEEVIFTDKRSAQEQLESDYLDAPRTSMELLCIISFNNFKSLSTLNTKDTKQFLDNVLGFDALTKYVDAAKDYIYDLRLNLSQTQADLRAVQSQITRMENLVFEDGDPKQIQQEINTIKQDIKDKENQTQTYLKPYHQELETLKRQLAEVTALGQVKKREIDFIKQGTCPTCGAPIDSSHLDIKIRERENLATQYKELNARINDLSAHITEISNQAFKYINEKNELVKSQENMLIKLTEQSKISRLNQDEINKLKKQVAEYEQVAAKLQIDVAEYEQLSTIFQVQIRQKVLESFIPSINRKITEISGMLNMRFIPQFDSMFKCSIQMGADNISTSSLSTGQLKMVDMVIILAILGSVISKIQSNVIFLDELFSNLDPRTRAELVSVLRATLPATSSILIISHQDMDTEIFDGQIKMKLEKNESGYSETHILQLNNN